MLRGTATAWGIPLHGKRAGGVERTPGRERGEPHGRCLAEWSCSMAYREQVPDGMLWAGRGMIGHGWQAVKNRRHADKVQ